MTSREIVYRAVQRAGPPRVPIHYANRDFEHSDTLGTGWAPAAGFAPSQPGMAEWGYVWQSLDQTMGQPHVHPLADWSEERVWRYIVDNQIPYNPLHDVGYRSIGCIPCTRPTSPDEEERAGRWAGSDKLECGIHHPETG